MQLAQSRINSIDILRGIVMIIMALDHVRDFFHNDAFVHDPTDMTTTYPLLFFTRWITHFCAPVFVFLSGVSAYLSGQKKSKGELSLFLIKRGFWLIIVEIVFITLAISFNPLYNIFFLQVIWAIGWSMIILGLLVRTSTSVIIVLGTIIFIGHNITDYFSGPTDGWQAFIWKALLTARPDFVPVGGNRIIGLLYAILPWSGIMMLGYGFGSLYNQLSDVNKRRKTFLGIGIATTIAFVVIRMVNLYGDRAPWMEQKDGLYTLLSFLNVTKYPPSLLYSLMTLGPAIIFLALAEKLQGRLSDFLKVFGRVPFFYYVCHFYLIHLLTVLLFFATGYGTNQIVDTNSPFLFRPATFGFDLWVVYLIWIGIIVFLYWPCRWFHQYKLANKQWWLSYV